MRANEGHTDVIDYLFVWFHVCRTNSFFHIVCNLLWQPRFERQGVMRKPLNLGLPFITLNDDGKFVQAGVTCLVLSDRHNAGGSENQSVLYGRSIACFKLN